MEESFQFTILHAVADADLAKFQQKCHEFLEELETKGKKQVQITTGLSCAAMPTAQGMGVVTIATCMFEYEATEEEWKTWQFGEKLKIMKP